MAFVFKRFVFGFEVYLTGRNLVYHPYLTRTAWGSTLDVGIWRLQTSDSGLQVLNLSLIIYKWKLSSRPTKVKSRSDSLKWQFSSRPTKVKSRSDSLTWQFSSRPTRVKSRSDYLKWQFSSRPTRVRFRSDYLNWQFSSRPTRVKSRSNYLWVTI